MKKLAVFLLFPFLLCGCTESKIPAGPMCRVVTQVQVAATIDGETYVRTYTDSPRMESVLCYLRLLERGRRSDIDPDSFRSDIFEITVFYSDGQQTGYRQLHDQLLQVDNGPWQIIKKAKLELLFP